MAGKKGTLPLHVKKKHFNHPGIELPIIQLLEQVKDPRSPSLFFRHSLTTILFMTLTGLICGATDWPKIIVVANGLTPWLSNYVDMSAGVPCERTFKNLLNALHPDTLENVLRDLASLTRRNKPLDIISFDGQTSRGTADRHKNVKGIHLLNAWSSANGICIGQIKIDDKSNEITAIPELMNVLDLKGSIITADALNTQKHIADVAIKNKADYLLPVKGNQPGLQAAVIAAFEVAENERTLAAALHERAIIKAREQHDTNRLQQLITKGIPACGLFFHNNPPEKSHGRIETRRCMTISAKALPMAAEWQGVQSIIRIDRERILAGKMSSERVYYISSLDPKKPEIIASAAREHWGVEILHWFLDVAFEQDHSRYRDRVGARNLATMRKMALNALSNETSIRGGIKTRQFAAMCNPTYRDKIIENLFSSLNADF